MYHPCITQFFTTGYNLFFILFKNMLAISIIYMHFQFIIHIVLQYPLIIFDHPLLYVLPSQYTIHAFLNSLLYIIKSFASYLRTCWLYQKNVNFLKLLKVGLSYLKYT